jgi:hypothetical protein
MLRRVEDRHDGTEQHVAIPCGSTRESVCPPCAHKARVLRMQQCTEGWHRTDEPEHDPALDPADQLEDREQVDDETGRRMRSTRRRQDAPDHTRWRHLRRSQRQQRPAKAHRDLSDVFSSHTNADSMANASTYFFALRRGSAG